MLRTFVIQEIHRKQLDWHATKISRYFINIITKYEEKIREICSRYEHYFLIVYYKHNEDSKIQNDSMIAFTSKDAHDILHNVPKIAFVLSNANEIFISAHVQDDNAIMFKINLNMSEPFTSQLKELIPELKDGLRHELEHTMQKTKGIWATSDREFTQKYFHDKYEIEAYAVGIYKHHKASGIPIDDILTKEQRTAISTMINAGVDKKDAIIASRIFVDRVKTKIKERYPNAKV